MFNERSSVLLSHDNSSNEFLHPRKAGVRNSLEPLSGQPLLSKVESVQQLTTSHDYTDYQLPKQKK